MCRKQGLPGSRLVTACASITYFYIAQIAGVETVAAITLRVRRGNTTASDAASLLPIFAKISLTNICWYKSLLTVISSGNGFGGETWPARL